MESKLTGDGMTSINADDKVLTLERDLLTREQIETMLKHPNRALNTIGVPAFRTLCDLALRPLSLESVRSEALAASKLAADCVRDLENNTKLGPIGMMGKPIIQKYIERALSPARVAEEKDVHETELHGPKGNQ